MTRYKLLKDVGDFKAGFEWAYDGDMNHAAMLWPLIYDIGNLPPQDVMDYVQTTQDADDEEDK